MYSIIDEACPFDTRVVEKEWEKTEHYKNLKMGARKICNCGNVHVIPIVVWALE